MGKTREHNAASVGGEDNGKRCSTGMLLYIIRMDEYGCQLRSLGEALVISILN